MEIKDFKGLEKVYAIPTGNNARRSKDHSVFDVHGIGRKYVELSIGEHGFVQKFCPTTGATVDAIRSGHGGIAGFIFFASEKDMNDWQKKRQRHLAVKDFCRSVGGIGCRAKSDKLIDALYDLLVSHGEIEQ